MKIRHFLYNAFTIEDGAVKIAIDPGLNFRIGKLGSLIPPSEWQGVTHILITHADPDHYWYADRLAQASGAPVVCGKELVRTKGREKFLPHPRKQQLYHGASFDRIYGLSVGQATAVDGLRILGVKSVHGPVVASFLFGLLKVRMAGAGTRQKVGKGAIGFQFELGGTVIANLGDTLFRQEWEGLAPDILMLPIGGRVPKNTMDEDEALHAVRLMSPKIVIPCHYNCSFLWKKNVNPADDRYFKKGVERMGIACKVLGYGDEVLF